MDTLHQHIDRHERVAMAVRSQTCGVIANSQRHRGAVTDSSTNPIDQLKFGAVHKRHSSRHCRLKSRMSTSFLSLFFVNFVCFVLKIFSRLDWVAGGWIEGAGFVTVGSRARIC